MLMVSFGKYQLLLLKFILQQMWLIAQLIYSNSMYKIWISKNMLIE
jgi:hypothetical protein